jgi:nitrile hydratase beta subunit
MNGVHDMGGMQCFGPVVPEPAEPLFHAAWEKRALALTLAMGGTGQWNIDLSRAARESLPPAVYLSSSYYEIWIRALEVLMLERGLVEPAECETGTSITPGKPLPRILCADQVAAALAKGSPTERTATAPARFRQGDRVVARNLHPQTHTRLPRYVRGHAGTVQLVHGAHLFADSHASRRLAPFDDTAHWLYTVVFDARDLWGPQADPQVLVSVDAWEPYLEAAA